jgi:hypothetical protein
MDPIQLLKLPVRYKPWRPKHLRLIFSDLAGIDRQPERPHTVHVSACIDWLCRAQDIRDGEPDSGGVSAGWSFEDGWLPSYPETSGYIVETFLAAADYLGRSALVDRAGRILDWELSIQSQDGSFPGHFGEQGSKPVIFNTGQIIHGMLAGYQQMGREECLQAAVRAGHWMVRQQDEDGCFRRSVHNGVPHTYNTRAVWGMLRAGLAAGDQQLIDSARRNYEWALSQQNEQGWYATNAFTPDKAPFTHTIAYAVRGLFEGGVLLQEERFIKSALKAGRALAKIQREDGWLAGTYDKDWQPQAGYCCLTGLAQCSLNWSRMIQSADETGLQKNVDRALGFLKRTHSIRGDEDVDDGGVAGSAPIWGRYSMFEYPNWAAKFFADALMMDERGLAIPPLPADLMEEG